MQLNELDKTLIILTLSTLLIAGALLWVFSVRITNTGTIRTIGFSIYQDSALTKPLTSIDWGTVDPGSQYGVVAWLFNTNSTAITINLTVTDWNPPGAQAYLTPEWNISASTIIQPQAIQPCMFKLTISPQVQGITNFSFALVLNATKSP
jgi:hypothetical protein